LIAVPAMINLDFADIKSVMEGQGSALFGIGMADGDDKAREAAARAIQSPLLEAQIAGAKSAIINVTGGTSMSAFDASEAVDFIREAAGNDIDIIFGVAINDKIGDAIIVSVIATGFELSEPKKEEEKKATPSTKPTSGVSLQNDDSAVFGSSSSDASDSIPGFFRRG
jgi:cell division protein ftsZ